VFRLYLDSLEKRLRSKVTNFIFREKRHGWLHPTVHIVLDNGNTIRESNLDNHFNLGFLKNIYLRPSCHVCPSKAGELIADLTIGDFWELSQYQPGLINRGGTSAVLVNTESGRQAIEACRPRLSLTQCPFSYLQNASNLRKCETPHPSRAEFFSEMDRLPFEELVAKYMKPRSAIVRNLAAIRRTFLRWLPRR
jgi:hypothetical protein